MNCKKTNIIQQFERRSVRENFLLLKAEPRLEILNKLKKSTVVTTLFDISNV